MQQAGEVGAGRHADAGEGLFDGAGAADAFAAFEHEDALAGARQVGGAGRAVVAGADDDDVPRARGDLLERRRQADLAQELPPWRTWWKYLRQTCDRKEESMFSAGIVESLRLSNMFRSLN